MSSGVWRLAQRLASPTPTPTPSPSPSARPSPSPSPSRSRSRSQTCQTCPWANNNCSPTEIMMWRAGRRRGGRCVKGEGGKHATPMRQINFKETAVSYGHTHTHTDTERQGQTEAHTISITHMDRHVATPTAADASLWPCVGCPDPKSQLTKAMQCRLSSLQTLVHTHTHMRTDGQLATCKDCK